MLGSLDFHEYFPSMLSRESERNRWVRFEQADVYLRVRLAYMRPQSERGFLYPVGIDIANISMPEQAQRKGTFKRLIVAIRALTQLPILLENVREDWAEHLVTRGWVYVPNSNSASIRLEPGVQYPSL